jgi:hypothetical protein
MEVAILIFRVVLLMALLSLKALSGEKRSTRDVYGSYLRA